MARVVAYVPDLLFGSNVLGMLRSAGHQATLCGDREALERAAPGCDVLVVDLTAEPSERLALVSGLELEGTRTLGFYSHVEAEVRSAALEAGLDRVVPRSRLAREGPALVAGLIGEP